MNSILDIGIIIFILFGAVLGFKRGFTKELVEAVGFILVIVLAYFIKNPLSIWMYEHLPFIKLGILKGVEVINIIIYEMIAFILCIIILSILLRILLLATTFFEKILNATIVLGIPSKLAGAVIGLVHHFIFAFIILYVATLTCFNFEFIRESELREKIVNNTPLLSGVVDKSVTIMNEFVDLKEKYENQEISDTVFKTSALDLFLKYKVITVDSLDTLFEQGKITKFEGYADLLNKYKEENNDN